jgi:hypothetical protein
VITEIDSLNKAVSGSFTSTSRSFSGGNEAAPIEKTIHITKGTFYKIPYLAPASGVMNSFVATIDGANFSASSASIDGQKANHFLTINALSGTELVQLSLYGLSPCVHNLDQEFYLSHYWSNYPTSNESYLSVAGTITISKYDSTNFRVEGSFNFSAIKYYGENPIPITGSFGVTYH